MPKITKISPQVKHPGRYSIYLDDVYAFSLSADALLERHLAAGDELSAAQVVEFTQLSAADKLYNLVLRYIAMRPRTAWELKTYLERKKAPAPLIEQITNRLTKAGLIDDLTFAKAFLHDRQLFRPTSRRKIILELKAKHVAADVIQIALSDEELNESATLRAVITAKRRQTRYQDDLKLMQYLARQGFNYGDIKDALAVEDDS